MPNVTVQFEVKPGDGVSTYSISVGNKSVTLVNGKGSLRLANGEKHFLLWWFTGQSGAMLSITGTQGATKVVEVKKSKIPAGESEGAGAKRFQL